MCCKKHESTSERRRAPILPSSSQRLWSLCPSCGDAPIACGGTYAHSSHMAPTTPVLPQHCTPSLRGNKWEARGDERRTRGEQEGMRGEQEGMRGEQEEEEGNKRGTRGNKKEEEGRRRKQEGNKRETRGNKRGKKSAQWYLCINMPRYHRHISWMTEATKIMPSIISLCSNFNPSQLQLY